MSAPELAPDPFRCVADPSRYVPRAATEQALAELRAALGAGPGRAIAFTGPAGIGKSLLVGVLAEELAPDYTFACLQATPPGVEQVCESALHALGENAAGDAVERLARRAEELARRGRPLVLVLDGVDALAADRLAELPSLCGGALRLLLVAGERDGLDADLRAFGPGLEVVRLAAPLSRSETEEYLRARLEAAGAPADLRVRLCNQALELWRRSRGNPQCLHGEISQLQLELWRETEAEPRLRLVPDLHPAAGEADPVLGDLEVGEELETVTDAEACPEPEPLAPPPVAAAAEPELPSPPPQARGRGTFFAAGLLTGAVLASSLWALTLGVPWERAAHVAPEPSASAPALPEVAAAPEPEPVPEPAAPPPAPAAAKAPPAEPEPEPAPPVAAPREPARAEPAVSARPVPVNVQALPWATIYVDGRLVGETPLGDLPVDPGVREFRAEMADGRVLTKRVQVRAGTRVIFE
jgi:type II secretory pathway predicted ATPase ExeA